MAAVGTRGIRRARPERISAAIIQKECRNGAMADSGPACLTDKALLLASREEEEWGRVSQNLGPRRVSAPALKYLTDD